MEAINLSPRDKALAINLDTRTYGSFAEIGAGQETAAWFFKAGAASGTQRGLPVVAGAARFSPVSQRFTPQSSPRHGEHSARSAGV